MIQFVKKLTRSSFARNVAIVATGTAGAQAISMAFMPFITRLYGPEVFGLQGAFMSILSIFTPIAALTYPIAIVLQKSDGDAKAIARLSFSIALAMAFIIIVVLLFASEEIAALFGVQVIADYMLLIPLGMMFGAIHQIMQQWLIRKKQFKATAKIAVIQTLTLNSAKAGLGWFYPLPSVLILLATASNGFHAFLLWLQARKQCGVESGFKQSEVGSKEQLHKTVSMKKLAFRYSDFPFYRAPEALLSAFSIGLPVLLLSSLFGPAYAGFYALAKSVLKLPNSLIGKAIGDVYYQKLVDINNESKPLFKRYIRVTTALFLVSVVPYSIVILFGPTLFKVIFGNEWMVAGVYAQFISIWMVFALSTTPALKVLVVINKQAFFLIYRVVFVVLNVLMLYLGFGVFKDDVLAVALLSLISCLMCMAIIIKVGHFLKLHDKKLGKNIQ